MKSIVRIDPRHCVWLSTLIATPLLAVSGQVTRNLSLNEAVTLGYERSPDARAATAQFDGAKAVVRGFQSRMRPQVQLSTTFLNFDRGINPITLPDGSQQYIGQSNNQATATLGVSQVVERTGGTLTMTSGLSRTDQFGNLANHSWQSTPVLLTLTQPLFQTRAMDWVRLEATASYEVAQYQFTDSRALIARTVAAQYMALHRAVLALRNARTDAAFADTLLTFNESRYRTASILVLELTRTEIAALRARIAVDEAQLARDRASAALSLSLGFDEDTVIETTEPFLPDTTPALGDSTILRGSLRNITGARFRLDSIAGERRLAEARASAKGASNFVASIGFNQKGNTLPLAYDSPLGKQRATLGVTVPLIQWGAGQAAIDAARFAFLGSLASGRKQVDQARQDAVFASRSVRVAWGQARLAALADSIAAVQFRIARVQYTAGALSYTEFSNFKQEKDNTLIARIEAVSKYWDNVYQLKRLLGLEN